MTRLTRRGTISRRLTAVLASVALVATSVVGSTVMATNAAADPAGAQQRPAGMVTAESLPTAQIDGVVWTQVIVGNTVFVGGSFTSARPPGSPAGTNEVPRTNLMSYNLTTGQLTTFAPVLNSQVKTMAASPDGSRLYVGGQFTSVNGQARYRLAAFDVATGNLISGFQGGADYIVNSIAATQDTVYVGGLFSIGYSTGGGGAARSRLAAFSASTGALLNWAPTPDNGVQAMVLAPSGDRLVIAGAFANVNGAQARGTAAIDLVSGASLPWALNSVVTNNGTNGAILTLSTDGTSIYGGGYKFGGANANTLEGTFKVDSNGTVQWIEDCHGDTYGVYAGNAALFQVGHSHYCGNNLGWPQPATWNFNRGVAFTKEATGTLIREPLGYANWSGRPSPSLISWFPLLDVGTFTGKSQAAWSVTGNSDYVVLGGEFPTVNGVAQQGLARFAVEPIAPGKRGAELSGSQYRPTLRSTKAGSVNISFLANWDRDDRTMTYKIIRDGVMGSPIYTTTVDSSSWDRPAIGFTDSVAPGTTHGYRIQVIDGDGNITMGDGVNITAATSDAAVSNYGQTVVAQGASLYWPMDDTTTAATDQAGYNGGVSAGGVTAGAAGGISGTAMTFNGSNGKLSSSGSMVAPNTLSMSVWFKTTSTSGGRLAGFSDLQFDNSGHRDRQIYLNNTGRVSFGVYGTTASSITSAASFNDGNWHQAVATLGANGMALYVDGAKVGSRTDVTSGEKYIGYWRLGGDTNSGWSNSGSSAYFNGQIDEFSVYPTVLTTQQVLAQYTAAGRTSPAPADAYGAAVYNDDPQLFWRLGDTSGTAAVDTASGLNPGTYNGTVTKGVAGAITGTTNTAVSMNGTNGFIASNNSFANPQVYSVETWVKTTATTGRIVGFGNTKTGLSTSYDRQLYLQSGKVVFGAASPAVTLTSPTAINDGQWHHLVGTQGPGGMTLWVDGQSAGSNGQASAMSYTGYWRSGGDRATSSTASYLNGVVDEVAVYPTVLSGGQVVNHFTAGGGQLPNQNPTASFTNGVSFLTVNVNGAASADADGTIAAYSWNWGDGSAAGSGATASHTYAAAGTYQVTLTVTDNRGGTSTTSQSVTATAPPANQLPVASFTATPAQLSVTVDGSASSDPDGSVASYSWNFGDGATATGAQPPVHTYAATGTYPITLTVTDNTGATATSSQDVSVTAPPPNETPTASFTQLTNGLTVNLQSTSTDSDGQVVTWQWNFGDNSSDSGEAVVHTFAASGTYPVTLTVTDNGGATATSTQNLTVTAPVTPNQPPVAAFTSSAADLTLTVNGSGSSDPDGSISSYAWDFGDGTTDQVTTPSATHTYLAAGTYQVTLTVTDNNGATDDETGQVTVTSPGPVALASDLFSRTVVNGFGTADTGGPWTIAGGNTNFSVNNGTGNIRVPAAGSTLTAALSQVASPDLDITFQMAMDKPATGSGLTASVSTRKVGNSEYRVSPRFTNTGGVQVQLIKVVSGASTVLTTTNLSTFGYTAGEQVSVRVNISGSSTVTLQSKVWKSSVAEPAAWQSTATDSSNPLTSAGNVQLINYLSGSSTNAPVVMSYDNLKVYAIAP